MSLAKLILVRHAAVAQDAAVPSANWSLSTAGRQQAKSFAQQLADLTPTAVITSEEAKARETGQILAQSLALRVTEQKGLEEHHRQSLPYYGDVRAFQARIAQLFARPDTLIMGEETAYEALHRFEMALTAVWSADPTISPLIVTHGTVMTLFISHHNPGIKPYEFWRKLTMPSAVVLSLPRFQIISMLYHPSEKPI